MPLGSGIAAGPLLCSNGLTGFRYALRLIANASVECEHHTRWEKRKNEDEQAKKVAVAHKSADDELADALGEEEPEEKSGEIDSLMEL